MLNKSPTSEQTTEMPVFGRYRHPKLKTQNYFVFIKTGLVFEKRSKNIRPFARLA
jgi:hypothetical protein